MQTLYWFIGLFIIVFIIDYFFINKRKLSNMENKNKKRKKKIKRIGELDYLVSKFKLNEKKLNKDKVIIVISLLNSFIISFVSSIVMLLDIMIVLQLLIAFVLLFSLIYALYEIYGRYLKKVEEKNE